MAKHLKSHRSSFNMPTVVFIAKGNSSSYNNLPVLLGKKAPSSLPFLLLYKKGKNWLGCPKWPLGFPTLCFPNASFFQKGFYKLLNQLQNWPVLYEEGPAWLSRNFFHAAASVARPSKAHGSRNWTFMSNFSTWFLMASILAGLSRSWSSKNCRLMATWLISFFSTWSSMAFTCCVLASASWYLCCNISRKASWSGNPSSLCSAFVWRRLYVFRSLLKYSEHAPCVFFTAFLNSSLFSFGLLYPFSTFGGVIWFEYSAECRHVWSIPKNRFILIIMMGIFEEHLMLLTVFGYFTLSVIAPERHLTKMELP